jgi:hypothetical protein
VNPIDQIYCTHCTYGSSALERRDGELAHRTLGYSARAGSVAAAELRTYYRQIERYLYYYLPRDTPAEEKRLLTDCTAPRRMLFLPGVDGFQFLAQVCYRAADSEGRPGSYFAHALRQAETAGAPRWSALDCLRLWQAAGWVGEDSPGIPFLLPALRTLDDMLPAPRAAIGDRTLRPTRPTASRCWSTPWRPSSAPGSPASSRCCSWPSRTWRRCCSTACCGCCPTACSALR